ncbi:MAG: alanine--tRNA ligase [Propionibacteriaceae bacterium]|jgi:alanyl-tRNA synthetase|nr:alanine--tRNA ligase [Propionibacteriaceae bacterium]
MRAAEVGARYVRFFEGKGHVAVPSTSLVYNDPTLLFVNAGMVPFKPYFIGAETPPWLRAASVQKCVRTLDIEEVGKTTRHGTFFQMNGNFSFGDYFKKEAIEWAWELVTSSQSDGGYGFSPDKVWVTVLGPGFHPDYPDGDREAAEFWKKVGVPEERIQPRNLKDNYWNMGVPGPGGPCSEIYIDRGSAYGPEGGPEADEDRYLEIWNLVFQTENLSKVRAKDDFDIAGPLPSKNIDTGMGLERTAYLLQGVENMYEIDQVRPVIDFAAEISGHKYGANHDDDVRLRVVADHIRSGLMLMSDGVTPGNEARGYVLRRLLRRSIRAMRLLGVDTNVLVDLLDVSRNCMQESYPEIANEWERVRAVAQAEDETFRRTLAQGVVLFDTAVAKPEVRESKVFSGDQAFQLHDTYGFPIDLTLEMAAEVGLSVDRARFDELMNEQRQRAKADAKAKKGNTVAVEAYRELREAGETPFRGYTDLKVNTKIRGIVADGSSVTHAEPGEVVELILEETPFYAEAGGQDSDTGTILIAGVASEVLDVQRAVPGLVVHKVQLAGDVSVGDEAEALVDVFNRRGACQAHSATHLISAALRQYVGKTATQAGSYNKPGYLRFDFSATAGLSEALKQEVEARVNQAIQDDLGVSAQLMKLEEAKAMGAQAMFGEKYPPIVRMVEMGGEWSRELCGGTHVASSSQVGLITLLSESSIGAGTRRVECLVSADAFTHLAAERALVHELTSILKTQPDQLRERVEKLVTDLKVAEKRIAELKAKNLSAGADEMLAAAETVGDIKLVAQVLPDVGGNELRTLALSLRDRLGGAAGVVALVGGAADKPALVVATTAAAREAGVRAGELVRIGTKALGGKGGGHDDLAQGGGTDAAAAPSALADIKAAIVASIKAS